MKIIEQKLFVNPFVIIFFLFIISSSNCAYSQWDKLFETTHGRGAPAQLGIGISSLHQLNLPKPLIGMNLKFRVENNSTSIGDNYMRTFYYVGVSYFFKQEKQSEGSFNAIPKDTSLFDPVVVPYQFIQTVSYLMFDVGADYYLFSNEKETFSFYSGWVLGAYIPYYRGNYEIEAYDQTNYILQTEADWKENWKESKANFKAGINIGIDIYIGYYGSLYLETLPFVNLMSEKYLTADFTINSRFFLGFNMGYRYEF